MATRMLFNRRESARVDQRQAPRHRIDGAHVDAAGGEQVFQAALADISCFGCRLDDAPPLEPGLRLWLRLPDQTVIDATVAWARDGEAGCRFAAPIGQALMRSLLPGAS